MFRAVILMALSIVLAAAPSLAQTAATGAVTGTVRDKTGSMVPEADVSIRNMATNETRLVKSQPDGTFVFPLLPPGAYVVHVVMAGFAPATREDVRVNVTETANLSIELQVGAVTDAVQVSAATEIVQSSFNTLGRVVESRSVQGLPLVTRNYIQSSSQSFGAK
jgi:hypothetical protein